MGRLSVLSPRRLDRELEDWGERRALVGHQRVDKRAGGSARIPSCAGRNDNYLMIRTKEIT